MDVNKTQGGPSNQAADRNERNAMKTARSIILGLTTLAIAGAGLPSASAGDREWATAGKILTGVFAASVLSRALDPEPVYYPAPTYYTVPTVVAAPPPPPPTIVYQQSVVYQQPVVSQPTQVVVQQPVVIQQPAPVVVQPAPVYYVQPAPVVVRPAPVVVYRYGHFGHRHYHRHSHCR